MVTAYMDTTGSTTGAWATWTCASGTSTLTTREASQLPTGAVWGYWAGTAATVTFSNGGVTLTARSSRPVYSSPTPEETQRRKIINLKNTLKGQREVRPAKRKARALMRAVLTSEHWLEYRRFGSVRFPLHDGFIELGLGVSGNLVHLDRDGNVLGILCLQLGACGFVAEDIFLALYLFLRADINEARKTANTHTMPTKERCRQIAARRAHRAWAGVA